MAEIQLRLYFEPQLRALYTLFRIFGLIHFKLNVSARKFEHSRNLHILSTITYNFVRFMYGFAVISQFQVALTAYLRNTKVEYAYKSVGAQDDLLNKCCDAREYISALLCVWNYFRMRDILLPTINEMADIHHAIRKQANTKLFVDGSLTNVLFFKLCITLCRLKLSFISHLVTLLICHIVWIFGYLIPELTFASYVYSQLFLISVYLNMNELLEASAGTNLERRKLRKLIRNLISLSNRIHSVEQRLNEIYMPVFLSTFIGAMFDINTLYLSLKIIFYRKYNKEITSTWRWIHRIQFPSCISYTFDAYLIGSLTDHLLQAENGFRTLLMTISNKRMLRSRDVEMAMLRGDVFELGAVMCGKLKVDQQFAFDYAINIVLNFAVTCLQFYAGEEVYATN